MGVTQVDMVNLDPETVLVLSDADSSLGRLAGAMSGTSVWSSVGGRPAALHVLHSPRPVTELLLTREAAASCRIEGNHSSLADVLRANAFGHGTPGSDIRAIQDYAGALSMGSDRINRLPLGLRLIRELHIALMQSSPKRDRQPGQYRDAPGLEHALEDLEGLFDEAVRLPVLIQIALLHGRLAKLRPFSEGNGELGRIMIMLHLLKRRILPLPVLDLSAYFERHRDEYLERLHADGVHGEIQQWLQFFLAGVAVQAAETLCRLGRLELLWERYRMELVSSRSRAKEVVDLLLVNPFITVRQVQAALGVTQPGALKLLRGIEQRGWLQCLGTVGRGGRAHWVAPEVMRLIEAG
ncbi:MAG: Fic family protein [Acidimicrobiales bacterium]